MRVFSRIFNKSFCYPNIGDIKMTLSFAIKKRIEDLLLCNGLNVNMLATKSGLNESTIRSILKGKCNAPNMQTIYYICIGFGITLADFYNSKIFNPNNLDDN